MMDMMDVMDGKFQPRPVISRSEEMEICQGCKDCKEKNKKPDPPPGDWPIHADHDFFKGEPVASTHVNYT